MAVKGCCLQDAGKATDQCELWTHMCGGVMYFGQSVCMCMYPCLCGWVCICV